MGLLSSSTALYHEIITWKNIIGKEIMKIIKLIQYPLTVPLYLYFDNEKGMLVKR